MGTSPMDSLSRRFARRAAEELIKRYGAEGARAKLAERAAAADPADERMLGDILAALNELQRRDPG